MSAQWGEYADQLHQLRSRVEAARGYLRVAEVAAEHERLTERAADANLWDDPDEARLVTRKLAELADTLGRFEHVRSCFDDLEALVELVVEGSDAASEDGSGDDEADERAELRAEVTDALTQLAADLDELELLSLLGDEHDENDAICEINSGAGGTDACDWAEMMLRMYQRWSEQRGYEVELLEATDGGEAGLSSATFVVRGRHAFGFLKAERGVHRLIRFSPFDSSGRRHTAFASLSVVPLFDEVADEVAIDPTELRIDTYRSSGAGGQHVNVTDSAVRITHLPTGTVVACQNERSQHQNKDRAMQMLAAKLADLARREREEEMSALAGEQREVAWGSQIRTYTLHPDQRIKDHRTGTEIGNVEPVLDGGLDGLMEAYLRWARTESD